MPASDPPAPPSGPTVPPVSGEDARQLTDSLPALIWTSDAAGRIDYCNRRLLEYVGRSLEQMRGDTWLEVLHPDDVPRARAAWARAIATGKDYEVSYRVRSAADGQYRWFLARATPVRDDHGNATGWHGTATNIDDYKRAEESLRRSEQLLRRSQAAAHVGSFVVEVIDPDDRSRDQVHWSDENYRIFGLEPGAIAPSLDYIFSVMHPDDRPRVMAEMQSSLRERRPYELEHRIIRPDGERVVRLWSGVDVDSSGRPVRVWGTCQDITEQKRTAQALQEADRRKNEFLATLAHELRNPLAPIRYAIKIAREPQATEIQRKWAYEVTERQVGHMARLLDDLLEASRISRGQIGLRRQPTTLHSALQTAIETACPLIELRKHRLTVDLPQEPIWLDADPVRLAQIFANLLTNAAKYTDTGGEIALRVSLQGPLVVTTVRDTGIGIGAEMLPRLFEMFSQSRSALKRAEGGLGIGLSLARGLVELHGGTVEAHSAGPGQGSEFTVRLPLSVAPAAPAPQPVAQPDSDAPLRILVADDNRDSAESLALLLRLDGHEVEVAHDGREALNLAATCRPDIALLDIGMPELNGYEVARRIRAESWGGAITLIAITGWGQEADQRRALQSGFDHHVTKPVDPALLDRLLSGASAAPRSTAARSG